MRRGFPVTKVMQSERRKRAEDRNAEYEKLTPQQKLAKLPAEPHAAKQRAKLLKKIEGAKAKAPLEEAVKTSETEPSTSHEVVKVRLKNKYNKKGDSQ